MTTTQTNKPSAAKAKIITLILAAAAAVSPLTIASEGTVNKAYLDPIKKPTICNGHTKGVRLGMVATDKQCKQWLIEDMTEAMQAVIKVTPELAENTNALQAAGDFTFNSGPGGWPKSPMAFHFKNRNWVKGCNSFVGYYDSATFKAPQKRYYCRPKPGVKGRYLCRLPGLVTRRERQKQVCLTGIWS